MTLVRAIPRGFKILSSTAVSYGWPVIFSTTYPRITNPALEYTGVVNGAKIGWRAVKPRKKAYKMSTAIHQLSKALKGNQPSLEHAGFFPITLQFGMSEPFKAGNMPLSNGISEPARSPLLSEENRSICELMIATGTDW